MKKIFLLLYAVCAAFAVKAQVSWKDSVQTKHKVTDAYYADQVIYFKAKKGWGIYDHVYKKVLVEPGYQFVKMFSNQYVSGILFVQNNMVGLMEKNGTVKMPAVYQRLGYHGVGWEEVIANKTRYVTDSTGKLKWHSMYSQLVALNEISLTVHDGKVLLNNYETAEMPSPIQVVHGDIVSDSLDANGLPVFPATEPYNQSGIFDLKTNTWILPQGSFAKGGFVGRNLLLQKEVTRDGENVYDFTVWNAADQGTYKLAEKQYVNSKKSVAVVLADYQPGYLYCRDSSNIFTSYIFESGGKWGLYSHSSNMVLVEPQYDFAYGNWDNYFSVKNGKVGLADPSRPSSGYENVYEQLAIHELHNIEVYSQYVSCNGTAFEKYARLGTNEEFYLPGEVYRNMLHSVFGLQVFNGKMVVHDFSKADETPQSEMDVFDENGEPTWQVVSNFPGACYSGVFDPAGKKWLVPQKYSYVQPYEAGYACLKACNWERTYSYYSKEGKAVFTDLKADALLKDEKAMGLLTQFGQGKINMEWLPPTYQAERYVFMQSNGKAGVFDLENLKWKIEPVYQNIIFHPLENVFTVVDSGKIGLLGRDFRTLVPVKYQRINMLSELGWYSANDTFLYAMDSLRLVGLTDTLKTDHLFSDKVHGRVRLDTRLEKNKLYVEEELYDPDFINFDELGNELVQPIDTSRSGVWEVGTIKKTILPKGWILREWDKGLVTKTNDANIYVYDLQGKQLATIPYTDSAEAACTQKWFWHRTLDNRYFTNATGELVAPTNVDKTYFTHNYQPAGFAYHYFDGQKFLEGPEGFSVLCANQSGLLLGYTYEPGAKGTVKKYKYYNPASKEYTPVELELSNGLVKVYPVKDGFVLFNYDFANKYHNCFVLENDLKTVKSTFRKLGKFKVLPAWHLNPAPVYELYTDKKIMYFDRDFQFIHESNYQDKPNLIFKFNRIILTSKFKTIVMDWTGRQLKQ